MRKIRSYKQDFLKYLKSRGKTEHSIKMYEIYMDKFLAYSPRITKVSRLDLSSVIDFQNRLSKEGYSQSTINGHISALRSFCIYLTKISVPCLSPIAIELPKVRQKEAIFLSSEEIDKLLNACEIVNDQPISIRNRAILEVLASSGLRVSELCNLDRDHVSLDTNELRVINGKGGKNRIGFISEAASFYIQKYFDSLNPKYLKTPCLFICLSGPGTGERINPRTIQRLVKELGVKAGINKDIHVHTIRHSFASKMLANGANLREAQELLGHASISTTQRYTHITNNQLKEAYNKAQNGGRDELFEMLTAIANTQEKILSYMK